MTAFFYADGRSLEPSRNKSRFRTVGRFQLPGVTSPVDIYTMIGLNE